MNEAVASMYASEPKIYARRVDGSYARLRLVAMFALLGVFYLLPWLSANGTPLVLFDLPARRFHLFGLSLVPQDLFLLTGLLVIAALTLLLFTTVAGRLWCGYACPQTVWTEAFMWLEHWAEGDRHARQKLDRAPWNLNKLRRRGAKHALWLLLAAWTGLSFVGYFIPMEQLVGDLLNLQLAGWPLFWSAFYGFATWGNAGFMREQVCRYMCPYARFQSAMFDADTLIIGYDDLRGEPRKSVARRGETFAGDCIDCTLCVQVCPTGIDIRNGLQYECIACAACVDACNAVMDKVGKPRGLVRYSSFNHDRGRGFRLLRPRSIGYGLVWLAVIAVFLGHLSLRADLVADVVRDRHSLYRTLADGRVENLYTLKLTNKTAQERQVTVSAWADDGIPVELSTTQVAISPLQSLALAVAARRAALGGETTTVGIHFELRDAQGQVQRAQARFIGAAP